MRAASTQILFRPIWGICALDIAPVGTPESIKRDSLSPSCDKLILQIKMYQDVLHQDRRPLPTPRNERREFADLFLPRFVQLCSCTQFQEKTFGTVYFRPYDFTDIKACKALLSLLGVGATETISIRLGMVKLRTQKSANNSRSYVGTAFQGLP